MDNMIPPLPQWKGTGRPQLAVGSLKVSPKPETADPHRSAVFLIKMEQSGIEPLTCTLRTYRSPN